MPDPSACKTKPGPLRLAAMVAAVAFGASSVFAAAGDAKGTVTYKGRTATIKYAYLVKGPDMVSKQTIRRLILSANDIGARIAACKTMGCTDGDLTEGLEVNFDSGPRLNYWMVLNGQKIQYSGTLKPEVLATSASDARRMAGKLVFDDAGAGGPKVDIEFDAALVKEATAP
ncbi:MAG: hypothetical protein ABI624_00560 [Casimicrobiaceae bacterium]